MAERGNQPHQSTGIEKGYSAHRPDWEFWKDHTGQGHSSQTHGSLLSSTGRSQGLHGMGIGASERWHIHHGHSEVRFKRQEQGTMVGSGADEERVSVRQKEPLEGSVDSITGDSGNHQRRARQEHAIKRPLGYRIPGKGVHRRERVQHVTVGGRILTSNDLPDVEDEKL